MSKRSMKPAKVRLTLSKEAVGVFAKVVKSSGGYGWLCVPRSDGKYDMPVSASLYDQLQTAALPKENFSDTILRLAKV